MSSDFTAAEVRRLADAYRHDAQHDIEGFGEIVRVLDAYAARLEQDEQAREAFSQDLNVAAAQDVCAVCQRHVSDGQGGSVIGMRIAVFDDTDITGGGLSSYSAMFKRIYPELTLPLDVSVCYVCWLKSLGVTPHLAAPVTP